MELSTSMWIYLTLDAFKTDFSKNISVSQAEWALRRDHLINKILGEGEDQFLSGFKQYK